MTSQWSQSWWLLEPGFARAGSTPRPVWAWDFNSALSGFLLGGWKKGMPWAHPENGFWGQVAALVVLLGAYFVYLSLWGMKWLIIGEKAYGCFSARTLVTALCYMYVKGSSYKLIPAWTHFGLFVVRITICQGVPQAWAQKIGVHETSFCLEDEQTVLAKVKGCHE